MMSNFISLFEKQKTYFASLATRPLHFRKKQLRRLKEMIVDNEKAIVKALHQDLGKPHQESFTSEIAVLVEEIKHAEKHLNEWTKPRVVHTPLHLFPAKSEIHVEPLGTVLIIGPWNYPFQLAIAPLIGAISAGNCAVLKPSELTPATSAIVKKLIFETFEPKYIATVEGGVEETTDLLGLPFDHIFFTGSTAVGRIVMKAAAANLTPVTLELGGKSPCIVYDDADIALAARRIAWGKFVNAGQTCVATDYVYAHEDIADQLIAEIRVQLRDFFGEDPQKSQSYARIVNGRNFDRLSRLMESGRTVAGGRTVKSELYIEPTLLDQVTWNDPVMSEEIFGPLLPILRFRSFDEITTELRRRDKPLAAYFFSASRKNQQRFLSELSFGGGCINDTIVHLSNVNLPFGGVGASGMGSYHGKKSFSIFTHEKSIVRKSTFLDFAIRYPPYTREKYRWLRRLFGFGAFALRNSNCAQALNDRNG